MSEETMERVSEKIGRNLRFFKADCLCNKYRIKHGKKSIIEKLKVTGGRHIRIGGGVCFRGLVTLCCIESFYGKKLNPILSISDQVFINDGAMLECVDAISVGKGTHIGCGALVIDYDHIVMPSLGVVHEIVSRPVSIGSGVWIGAKSTILKGVTIGDNAVVGANSLVNKDVPENTMVAGNPAVPIKVFNFKTQKWEPVSVQRNP